jgi:hypothetical protein
MAEQDTTVCAHCAKPLVVEVDNDNDDRSDNDNNSQVASSSKPNENNAGSNTVPDDVRLSCNDHFHWECLLSAYEIHRCPACSRDITSSASGPSIEYNTRILVDLTNEGGFQEQIDIFPLLQEESYLRAYPEERKCRAFLEFCREGDYRAIVDLLKSCSDNKNNDDGAAEDGGDDAMDVDEDEADDDEDDEDDDDEPSDSKSAAEVLRYQDPLHNSQSGLHAAVSNGHREVAWLLLLLASDFPQLDFPALVYQEAASLDIMREPTFDEAEKARFPDIRSLKDGSGRTAEDVAREMMGETQPSVVGEGEGLIWNGWIGNGRLAMPVVGM